MDQTKKILVNQAVENEPETVFRVVAPFGSNVHVAIEACTGAAEFAEQLIEHSAGPSSSLIPVMSPG